MIKDSLMAFFALLIVAAFALIVVAAVDTVQNSPADNVIVIDGNVSFDVSVSPGAGRNITAVYILTNFTGVWTRNLTNDTFLDLRDNEGLQNLVFLDFDNLSDGAYLGWRVEIATNATTNVLNNTFGTNFTVRAEYPPNVSISFPAQASDIHTPNGTMEINVSVSSDFIDGPFALNGFNCQVYSNDTGNNALTLKHTESGVDNATSFKRTVGVAEGQDIVIAVYCWESKAGHDSVASWATNVTFTSDQTAPVVSLSVNDSNNLTTSHSIEFNYTTTELNPQRFEFYTNYTGAWIVNLSRTDMVDGGVINFTFTNLLDGDYTVGGYFWDVAGNNLTVKNATFRVDQREPVISAVTNVTQSALLTVQVNWQTDKLTNGSINYGSTADLGTRVESVAGSAVNHSVNITVSEATIFFYNITTCVPNGRCNVSDTQQQLPPISAIYGGWNAYGMMEANRSMGDIATQSGADFVYWFNQSRQAWVSHASGSSTNANTAILGGSVTWLFKSSNGTWARNVATPDPAFATNLSTGLNFVSAPFTYTFINLSSSFTNVSTDVLATSWLVGGHPNGSGAGQTVDVSEVEFYAYYNNSDQRYVPYFRNETFNNMTEIRFGDAIMVGTPLNITWNGSDIVGNWTTNLR